MLVWTEKLSEADRYGSMVGSDKYFCGKETQFGMVVLAVCDHHLRFIDMDINKPASTSDYLTFCTCCLIHPDF